MLWKIGGKFLRRTDFKITLWYVFTFLISTLIICSFLYLRLKHQLLKEIDQFLFDETREIEKVLSRESRETFLLIRFEDDVMARKHYPFFFQILDQNGKPLYTSRGFQELEYELKEGVLMNARNKKVTREKIRPPGRRTPYRIISSPVYEHGNLTQIIQLGTPLRFVRKNLSHFRNNIVIALFIVSVLGALGGWILARRALSPIGYIASKARSITSENLNERLHPRKTGDEMDDLIETINGMIARLETSFKRMAEFTADVSHELKTPLCTLKGEAELLLSKERTAEDYQEGLAHLVERFDHLNRMINDLILLSKSDSSQVEVTLAPLRLDVLIRDIGDLFQILAEQKKIALKIDSCEEMEVMGDRIRLQQLFTNLIDNAVKFTPEGGSIRIRVEKNVDFARVKVIDTGMGIPKEEHENIFKRFYRLDKSRSRETGGAGLGLSIAEWIAHAHGGKIEVESELNQGSTFTVYLPLPKIASPRIKLRNFNLNLTLV